MLISGFNITGTASKRVVARCGGDQATGVAPRESGIVRDLAPDRYRAIVRSKTNSPGVGAVEFYHLNPEVNSRFGNLSSRGLVRPGADNVMIGGVPGRAPEME